MWMDEMRKSLLLKEMGEDSGVINLKRFKASLKEYCLKIQRHIRSLLVSKVINYSVQTGKDLEHEKTLPKQIREEAVALYKDALHIHRAVDEMTPEFMVANLVHGLKQKGYDSHKDVEVI